MMMKMIRPDDEDQVLASKLPYSSICSSLATAAFINAMSMAAIGQKTPVT